MATLRFKINDANLVRKIEQYVARRELAPRIRNTFPGMLPKIRKAFVEAFQRTRAYYGLIGRFENFYPSDVPAHVGLSPSDAEAAATLIGIIVSGQVNFANPRVTTDRSVAFSIDTEDVVMALQNRVGDNGSGIRWIDWLLGEGPEVAAQIKFGDYANKPKSRSGRAIMITKNITSTWSSEKYNNFSVNGTFLNDIEEDPVFQEKVRRIIQSELKRKLT